MKRERSSGVRARGVHLALCCAAACSSACASRTSGELRDSAVVAQRAHDPARLLASAEVFAASGDYVRAEQYLTLALRGGAVPRSTSLRLVQVCVMDRRFRAAVQHAEQYLGVHVGDSGFRYVFSTLLIAIGDEQRALEQLRRVLTMQPSHAAAHYALATLLRDSSRDLAGAHRHFRSYLQLAPDGSHSEEAQQSLLEELR